MGNLITIVHPAHGIIGDILTVILCLAMVVPACFVLYWMAVGAYKAAFLSGDPEPPLMPVKSVLQSLPLGAPRDGGAYILEEDGWKRLSDEEHERMLAETKDYEKGLLNPDGWDVRIKVPEITHPSMTLEIENDGPDDVEEEDEVERPDERMVLVS
jgi:hypothetical protein